jgi:hypothetical protein
MNYAFEMRSSATINIPSFIKVGSGIQKLIVGHKYRHTDTPIINTHRQEVDLISVHSLFQNQESRLKIDLSKSLPHRL